MACTLQVVWDEQLAAYNFGARHPMTPALAISRWIEGRTGWSIRKFVRTALRYQIIAIPVGSHTITVADPLPDDLREALDRIGGRSGAH